MRWRWAAAHAAVCALALTGCGSDDAADRSTPPPVSAADLQPPDRRGPSVLEGTAKRLNGDVERLARYRGRVVLVVNTASKCGFTPQFEALEALHARRAADGVTVLGFPSDDFRQELGSDTQVERFCRLNYGVTFPMFRRTHVTGAAAAPLFASLGHAFAPPAWNFTKYLLDRRGRPAATFAPEVAPDDPALTAAIDTLVSER